ncbi:MAG: asparagine synthase (glutamine-hydrolyzing), partial [Thermoleophilia bacterium]|nr:asparagine synthase (glutamine-hydrolyzing) [Thermoleophilia bacterium]
EALVHRGPDGDGLDERERAVLGHRRLSIIDLAGGAQPIYNEDRSLSIAANCEFFGFIEQRAQLERRGHRFSTASDTEVAVHLYEEYGLDFLRHLNGMFAIALWDEPRQRLVLARDRLGKKPLYWARRKGKLIFASEIAALMTHPLIERVPCDEAIDLFLGLQYIPPPLTGFRDVFKLGPAERLVFENGEVTIDRYWELSPSPKLQLSDEAAVEELTAILEDSTRIRMISDVPLGAFLSGGVDSSTVVALMARAQSEPVRTFSIAFDAGTSRDAEVAREVAAHIGTDHTELTVSPDMLSILPELVRRYGEPFGDVSAVPTYYVAKATREHVTVALTGDGGDELFAGYDQYRLMRTLGRVAPLARAGSALGARQLAGRIGSGDGRLARPSRRAERVMNVASRPFADRYALLMSHISSDEKRRIYSAEFMRRIGRDRAAHYLRDALGPDNGVAWLDRLTLADAATYLHGAVLTKVDIATMAVALEARAPLLDYRVAEFAARLPPHQKLRGGTDKWLLRQVAHDLVPREVLERPKQGFGIPLREWLRGRAGDVVRETLTDGRLDSRGILRPGAAGEAFDDFTSGRGRQTHQIWLLLMLELWFRDAVDQESLAGWGA